MTSPREDLNQINIGLRSIFLKDSSQVRKDLFRDFAQARWHRKLLFALPIPIQRLVSVVYAMSGVFFLNFSDFSKSHHIAIFQYLNETRYLKARFGDKLDGEIEFKPVPKISRAIKLFFHNQSPKKCLQLFRLSYRLVKKHGFLIGTREARFIWVYAAFGAMSEKIDFKNKHFYLSTESNPDTIAIALLAQKKGGIIHYLNHGFLDPELGLFFHDVFHIQGEALWERIRKFTLRTNHEVHYVGPYYPRRPIKLPIKNVNTIGIICVLSQDLKKLDSLIHTLQKFYPECKIEIRPHPNPLVSCDLQSVLRSNVSIVSPTNWKDYYPMWDLAIGGNTSAHIDLINIGIPSVGFDLDRFSHDRYGFYQSGFILKAQELSELHDQINRFYGRPDWERIAKKYL